MKPVNQNVSFMKRLIFAMMAWSFALCCILFTSFSTNAQDCTDNEILVVLITGNWGEEVSWDITDADANILASGSGYESNSAYDVPLCIPDGCYSFNLYDSFGDGWNGGLVTVVFGSDVIGYSDFPAGASDSFELGINTPGCGGIVTFGCTDPDACNYDAEAMVDDTSCHYPGCMDPEAMNYDAEALCETDGSCEYPPPCDDGNLVFFNMYDSFGDNWNGATYSLADSDGLVIAEGTLDMPASGVDAWCLADGCYVITVGGGSFDSEISWEMVLNGAIILSGGAPETVYFGINADGCIPVYGCTDETACNYNPDAEIDDESCTFPGCTDPDALNYDASAGCDDGSCEYPQPCDLNEVTLVMSDSFGDGWNGAMYTVADSDGNPVADGTLETGTDGTNDLCLADGCYSITVGYGAFDSEIGWEIMYNGGILASGGAPETAYFGINADGCIPVFGCTDVAACNYNPDAEIEDGSCTYPGCTDPEALNYDNTAGCDDDSCEYPEPCDLNEVTLAMYDSYGDGWNGAMYTVADSDGNPVADGTLENGSEGSADLCLPDGCYSITVGSGAFDSEIAWEVLNNGNVLASGGAPDVGFFGLNADGCIPIYGCMDPEACNYNSEAGYDDGSCTYPGCTDPGALNYDEYAGCDDGSCEYPDPCDLNNVTIAMTDSFGDNWNGATYIIMDGDGLVVAEGSHEGGTESADVLCLADGCYVIVVGGGAFDSEIGWEVISGGDVLAAGGAPDAGGFGLNAEGCEIVAGCTDEEACNYSADATYDDNSCTYPGCTNPDALNYDSEAGCDDGSCELCENGVVGTLYICTFANGDELAFEILDEDGNVVFYVDDLPSGTVLYYEVCLQEGVCYTANMYNLVNDGWYGGYWWMNVGGSQIATGDLDAGETFGQVLFSIDDSCPVYGCTDPDALNYDSEATEDDGSCEYPEPCDYTSVLFHMYDSFGDGWNGANYVLTDSDGNIAAEGTLEAGQEGIHAWCLADGCYIISVGGGSFDSEIYWEASIAGEIVSVGAAGTWFVGVNADDCNGMVVYGCTDDTAVNYNSEANVDDGSCFYCDDSLLVLNMWDTYGDGWNGATYSVADSDGNVVANGTLEGGADGSNNLCLADGCYSISVGGGYFDSEIIWELSLNGAVVANGGAPSTTYFGINADGCTPVPGCTDPDACNYDDTAEEEDGSCTYPGCTDPEALNYDDTAGCDDDSCEYPEPCDFNEITIYMADSFGDGWNGASYVITDADGTIVAEGTHDGGSESSATLCLVDGCYNISVGGGSFDSEIYWEVSGLGNVLASGGAPESVYFGINADGCAPIEGCTDAEACNYNPDAELEDGSCTYPGCTDENAMNYDADAGCDDGSCEYCDDNMVVVMMFDTFGDGWNGGSYVIAGEDGIAVADGSLEYGSEGSNEHCLVDGCYSMSVGGSSFDSEIIWDIYVNGDLIASGGAPETAWFGINADGCGPVLGCMDADACNYNVDAEEDDGSCTYPGCTDPEALNFDEEAGCDDDSCEYPEPCDYNTVMFYMYDSFGDNWNGATYTLTDSEGNIAAEGTLEEIPEDLDTWCLADGCYILSVGGGAFDSEIGWDVVLNDDLLASGGAPGSWFIGINTEDCEGEVIYGCTDVDAVNYNAEANVDDGSCWYCDDNAITIAMYDSWGDGWNGATYAILDADGNPVADGTLEGGMEGSNNLCLVDGCYSIAVGGGSFDSEIAWDINLNGDLIAYGGAPGTTYFGINADGCVPLFGCMDPDACNYDADAEEDDGSCTYPGCTDPEALNYNEYAGCDDDSCEYPEPCFENSVILWIATGGWGSEVSWELSDSDGNNVASGDGYDSNSNYFIDLCLADGCYTMNMYDSFGDGWNGGFYMVFGDDGLIADGNLPWGSYQLDIISINSDCEVDGCTDPEALNYDADATVDDNSCIYEPPGAQDESSDQALELGSEMWSAVSPNPTSGNATLTLGDLSNQHDLAIELRDLSGRLVYNESLSNNAAFRTLDLNLEAIPSGMYLLTVINGQNVDVLQIVKAN
jgi:hypothetical protein